MKRGSSFVKARSLVLISLVLATAACAGRKEYQDGGVYTRRTVCPQVAIPAATGDVTLFRPSGRTDAAAIDVVATITNVRSTCNETGESIIRPPASMSSRRAATPPRRDRRAALF